MRTMHTRRIACAALIVERGALRRIEVDGVVPAAAADRADGGCAQRKSAATDRPTTLDDIGGKTFPVKENDTVEVFPGPNPRDSASSARPHLPRNVGLLSSFLASRPQ